MGENADGSKEGTNGVAVGDSCEDASEEGRVYGLFNAREERKPLAGGDEGTVAIEADGTAAVVDDGNNDEECRGIVTAATAGSPDTAVEVGRPASDPS